jgi:superfamily II DNA helicase RecQ
MPILCRTFTISLTDAYPNMDDETSVNEFMQQVHVAKVYASVVNDHEPYWSILVFYSDEPLSDTDHTPMLNLQDTPSESEDLIVLTPEEDECYQALRQWRNQRAREDGIPSYVIAHNRTLKEIVRFGVSDKDDLLNIRGFRHRKIEKYGDDILDVLRQFNR